MNSPFSICVTVSYLLELECPVSGLRPRLGRKMSKYKEDSLKAAIVSSIESNWCAMSAGEGIVIGVWIGTFAPHCAIARWVGSTEGEVQRLYKV
jgi:hypothetical protein